jgi:hypothetical protein
MMTLRGPYGTPANTYKSSRLKQKKGALWVSNGINVPLWRNVLSVRLAAKVDTAGTDNTSAARAATEAGSQKQSEGSAREQNQERSEWN